MKTATNQTTENPIYVIVRSSAAGVHAGYLVSLDGETVELRDARRLWRWVVAKMSGKLASLSEVAVHGINSADSRSRIGVAVHQHTVIGVCEVLAASDVSRTSIEGAP